MGKFEQDLNDGKYGERIARDLLESLPRTRLVLDCRKDKRSMAEDVDFYWYRTDDQLYRIEIKTDFAINRTNNIVYEMTTSGNIGCFEKTKADFILYYDAIGKHMYCLSVVRLRYFVHKYKANKEPIKMGDYATGYLISLNEARGAGIIVDEWENIE